jgi:hypothetical protein
MGDRDTHLETEKAIQLQWIKLNKNLKFRAET